ncbi:restriction endonuclease subunit S [Bradyrhizobium sp. NDS-1]|uniref:restriction endonuclease subunit S n=1 Tax=Bradyrhizobium sp. NDS-1 TaxID=3080014 RepID=UPI00293F1241|nr:restriction endonuclease subunit S [Bradyrhizobium sp. NDS-1]WOH76453.1 restriction endonuclease subunit S [Bradyrhizobium sp. NDS-1]
MNAERLLAHYHEIADVPNAVARLRRFILDLAVRGKLVLQDPNDEPASELLKRIANEKDRENRKRKALPDVNEPPFDVPRNWRWTRVREVTSDRAQQVPQSKFTYIDVTAIDKEAGVVAAPKVLEASDAPSRARKVTRKGDVIYSCVRPYLLNVAVIETDFDPAPIASTAFAVLNGHGHVLPRYMWIVLRSPFMVECVEENQRGQAYPAINDADFAVLPFPLPPLAEQHRIVGKVNELMGLCDRLELARADREAARDRLAAASLARLNTPEPETFQADSRFVLDALPALTTRPDQIKQLRQTVLNLAMRGKLVQQDANDEPASELLNRIANEKGRSRRGPVSINPEDEPYALPKTWKWAALDQLIVSGPQNGISPKPTKREDAPKAISLTATTSGTFNPIYFKYVEANIPIGSDFWLKDGDLLFQRGNTREYVGMAAVYRGPPNTFLFPDLIMKVRVSGHVCLDYVHLASISPASREFLSSKASGAQATMPKINQGTLVSLPIPLPPLAEQRRIVAKVEALMALCDRLEASLASVADARRQLLDALLADALVPVASQELEAAE